MAKETIVVLRDDIDGTIIEKGEGETIKFAFDGSSYTIDLNTNNAAAFREAIKPYADSAAKEVSNLPRTSGASSSAKKSDKDELRKIREWARSEGLQVSGRGRVSAEVQQAYHAAH